MKNKDDYEVIDAFICEGKYMVTVMINNNAHVMEKSELNKWFGRLHSSQWKSRVA